MNYIAEAQGIWYEGDSYSLRVMLQNAMLLPICFPGHPLSDGMLFREDYFDSATRVRRGMLYRKDDNKRTWGAENVSLFPHSDGRHKANVFRVNRCYATVESSVNSGWTAVLGDNNAQSYWTVVFSEKMGLEAHYLTLKSKTYFGALPEVNRAAIPEANRQDILQALDAVVEAAPIQAPQPVIDACRNAACHMITAKFPESNPKGNKDLGQLASWLEKEGHCKKKAGKADVEATDALIELPDSYASYLMNELHRRAKANAAAARRTRPASQQDANLAVDAIAFLLQDFGWAEATV